MMLVTYDDAGGYYDHMVPPSEGVPNDEAPCHEPIELAGGTCGAGCVVERNALALFPSAGELRVSPRVARASLFDVRIPRARLRRRRRPRRRRRWRQTRGVCVCVYLRVAGRSYTPFDFRRLGLRSTALLASPWVAKGAVFQEPAAGPYVKTQIHTATYHNTLQYCIYHRIALSICISMNDYEYDDGEGLDPGAAMSVVAASIRFSISRGVCISRSSDVCAVRGSECPLPSPIAHGDESYLAVTGASFSDRNPSITTRR